MDGWVEVDGNATTVPIVHSLNDGLRPQSFPSTEMKNDQKKITSYYNNVSLLLHVCFSFEGEFSKLKLLGRSRVAGVTTGVSHANSALDDSKEETLREAD